MPISFPTVTNFHASFILFKQPPLLEKSFANLVLSVWWLMYAKFIILVSFNCNQFWGKHPIRYFQILLTYMLYTFTVLSSIVIQNCFAREDCAEFPTGRKKKNFAGPGTLWACVCLDNFYHSEINGGISTQWKKRSAHRSTTKIYSKLESSYGILHVSRVKSCPGSVIIETTLQDSAVQYSPFQGFSVSSLLPKELFSCPYE